MGYSAAPGSFLFSLRSNDDLTPFKSSLRDENDVYATFRGSSFGPYFGSYPGDMKIVDNAGSSSESYARLGNIYKAPPGYVYNAKTQALSSPEVRNSLHPKLKFCTLFRTVPDLHREVSIIESCIVLAPFSTNTLSTSMYTQEMERS